MMRNVERTSAANTNTPALRIVQLNLGAASLLKFNNHIFPDLLEDSTILKRMNSV